MLTNKHLQEMRSSAYNAHLSNKLYCEPLPTIDILNKKSHLNKLQIKVNKLLRSDSETSDSEDSSSSSGLSNSSGLSEGHGTGSYEGSNFSNVSLIEKASSFFSSHSGDKDRERQTDPYKDYNNFSAELSKRDAEKKKERSEKKKSRRDKRNLMYNSYNFENNNSNLSNNNFYGFG